MCLMKAFHVVHTVLVGGFIPDRTHFVVARHTCSVSAITPAIVTLQGCMDVKWLSSVDGIVQLGLRAQLIGFPPFHLRRFGPDIVRSFCGIPEGNVGHTFCFGKLVCGWYPPQAPGELGGERCTRFRRDLSRASTLVRTGPPTQL